MWTVLTILLWLLAAVLAMLLAALAAPLRLEFRATAGEALRYNVALRPFGRIGPRLSVMDSEKPSKKKPKHKAEAKKKGKGSRRDPRRIIRAALRLLTDIGGRLTVERASLDVRFGADDPAETGEIYGALTPLIYGTSGSRWVYVNVEPVFDHAVLNGRAALDVTLTPARLIAPFVRFGWSAFGPVR